MRTTPRGSRRSSRRSWIVALIGLAIAGAGTLYVLKRLQYAGIDSSHPRPCAGRLYLWSKALLLYAHEHNRQFPPDVDRVRPELKDPKVPFACPVSTRPAGESHYVYMPGLSLDADPASVLAYEPIGVHAPSGSNVLFVDARVEWVSAEQLRELVQQTLARLSEAGIGPVKTPELPVSSAPAPE